MERLAERRSTRIRSRRARPWTSLVTAGAGGRDPASSTEDRRPTRRGSVRHGILDAMSATPPPFSPCRIRREVWERERIPLNTLAREVLKLVTSESGTSPVAVPPDLKSRGADAWRKRLEKTETIDVRLDGQPTTHGDTLALLLAAAVLTRMLNREVTIHDLVERVDPSAVAPGPPPQGSRFAHGGGPDGSAPGAPGGAVASAPDADLGAAVSHATASPSDPASARLEIVERQLREVRTLLNKILGPGKVADAVDQTSAVVDQYLAEQEALKTRLKKAERAAEAHLVAKWFTGAAVVVVVVFGCIYAGWPRLEVAAPPDRAAAFATALLQGELKGLPLPEQVRLRSRAEAAMVLQAYPANQPGVLHNVHDWRVSGTGPIDAKIMRYEVARDGDLSAGSAREHPTAEMGSACFLLPKGDLPASNADRSAARSSGAPALADRTCKSEAGHHIAEQQYCSVKAGDVVLCFSTYESTPPAGDLTLGDWVYAPSLLGGATYHVAVGRSDGVPVRASAFTPFLAGDGDPLDLLAGAAAVNAVSFTRRTALPDKDMFELSVRQLDELAGTSAPPSGGFDFGGAWRALKSGLSWQGSPVEPTMNGTWIIPNGPLSPVDKPGRPLDWIIVFARQG